MSFELDVRDRSYAKLENVLRSCYAVLANRDHTSAELLHKQVQKGYPEELVEQAIAELKKDGYINDTLFAQGYLRSRLRKNHGPMRIRQDMRAKLIPQDIIDELLLEHEERWPVYAIQCKQKRFGEEFKKEQKWKAKVWRYLQYRGFSSSHIMEALNPQSDYLEEADSYFEL